MVYSPDNSSNQKNSLFNKKILVVDDDSQIRELMVEFLAQQGVEVATAAQGDEMMALLQHNTFDLIILDVLLPKEDGFHLCKKLRSQNIKIPVIMLTALDEDMEKIKGLNVGADDYLTKPFNLQELLARINAILRRSMSFKPENTADNLYFENWVLNKIKRQLLTLEGMEIPLTDGEYRLLEVLLENPREILQRELLLARVENRQSDPFDRSIDMRISRLRQKLGDDPKSPLLIKTVRGGGYILTCDVDARQ